VRATIVGAGLVVLVATLAALCVPSIRHLRCADLAATGRHVHATS
jgi:hypothetical protein